MKNNERVNEKSDHVCKLKKSETHLKWAILLAQICNFFEKL